MELVPAYLVSKKHKGKETTLMWKLIAIAITCPLCFGGCGASSGEMETASVYGVVTLDGTPLTTGMVYFVPEGGRGAKSKISEDGSYTLGTYGDKDGAIVGRHKVFIIASEGDVAFESEEPVKSLVPRRYTNAKTSRLEFEVKAGETNEAPLELTK